MKRSTAAIQDARQPGWFYLDDRLIDAHGSTIGAIGVAVYAALARHAKANGVVEVAYDTIAAHLDISRNTVKAKLRAIEAAGLIQIDQQTDDRGNPIGANIYTLCVIPEQKQERRRRGVPIIDPPGSNADPPHATVDQGGATIDPPGSNAAYKGHDSISIQSDLDPPPTPLPPTGGGGGGSRRDEPTETELLLLNFTPPFSARSAYRFRDLPADAVRVELEAARKSGTGPGALVERWKRVRPSTPQATPRPPVPMPPRLDRPADVLSPQEAARVLTELHKRQQERTNGTA